MINIDFTNRGKEYMAEFEEVKDFYENRFDTYLNVVVFKKNGQRIVVFKFYGNLCVGLNINLLIIDIKRRLDNIFNGEVKNIIKDTIKTEKSNMIESINKTGIENTIKRELYQVGFEPFHEGDTSSLPITWVQASTFDTKEKDIGELSMDIELRIDKRYKIPTFVLDFRGGSGMLFGKSYKEIKYTQAIQIEEGNMAALGFRIINIIGTFRRKYIDSIVDDITDKMLGNILKQIGFYEVE